jgi:type II secretory pathway predicted ATPase ExeA
MYSNYFQFVNRPFGKDIPSECILATNGSDDILGRLQYAAKFNKFVVVTGECGSGKSTLLRKLKDSLDPRRYDFYYITDSKLTPRHFYNGILEQMGKDGAFYRGDARRKLHNEIEIVHGVRHRQIAVVVDEAHLLDREMLEEIRFLLNFQMDSHSPLALILSGQPELEHNLDKGPFEAIRQRVDFRCRLKPLTMVETSEYIKKQLIYAGVQKSIFTDGAAKEIYAFSFGLPRLINKVCVSCLMSAFSHNIDTIDVDNVKNVIEQELK